VTTPLARDVDEIRDRPDMRLRPGYSTNSGVPGVLEGRP
jgi:hypothetical protein